MLLKIRHSRRGAGIISENAEIFYLVYFCNHIPFTISNYFPLFPTCLLTKSNIFLFTYSLSSTFWSILWKRSKLLRNISTSSLVKSSSNFTRMASSLELFAIAQTRASFPRRRLDRLFRRTRSSSEKVVPKFLFTSSMICERTSVSSSF